MNSVLASFTAAAGMVLDGTIAPPAIQANMGGGMSSGYDAGNWSSRRGYVYYPTMDTREELQPFIRTEVNRKTRWLTKNVGFAKRCTSGVAHMIGSLSPRPFTDHKEWNKL